MSIETGVYRIVNLRFASLVQLVDDKPTTTLTSGVDQGRGSEKWKVESIGGVYTFYNLAHKRYASVRQPNGGQPIGIHSTAVRWEIVKGKFENGFL
ncbi:unnamed protein product [Rhizoctonia solani]|uniref:Ricin B lectin domain-containing protein n=1 Tax=Rhizoctonia solani TaxID=456999 RepID=A0A8H3C3Z4_9AGAM|nr:unnamed protein product [Rhizoctonia solani]